MSELDDIVALKEAEVDALLSDMESTRVAFLSASREWLRSALPQAFNTTAEVRHAQTLALGPEGTRALKADLAKAMESLDEVVDTSLGKKELWTHLQEDQSPLPTEYFSWSGVVGDRSETVGVLPAEFRRALNDVTARFARIFVDHGYTTERYGDEPLLSLPDVVPPAMLAAINTYSNQNARLRDLRGDLRQAIEIVGRAQARGLWDQT
jgi:hypothetical protein